MIRPDNPLRLTRGSTARATLIGVVLGLIALVALLGTYALLSRHAPQPQPTSDRNGITSNPRANNPSPTPPSTNPIIQQPKADVAAQQPVTNLSASQLVTNLAAIDLAHGPLYPEQAAAWKQTLKLLVAKGQTAIPAIRDFLGRNQDVYFDAPGAAELMGVPSLRLALLGALEEIGGPEAIASAQLTLQATADPAELVVLAKFLDRAEPGKHRAEFARAAKESLALAAAGSLDGRDVAPLYEMLRTFGGAAEPAELERYANTWFDYTPITLAQWPDGAGLPVLIKLAQNAGGSISLGVDVYQRMVAELAVNSPAAAEALVELARENKIEMAAWPAISRALGGQTLHCAKSYLTPPSPLVSRPDTRLYHVAYGNQNFVEAMPPEETSAQALGDRIRLIDRVLAATTHPPAMEALISARAALSAQMAKAK